MGTRIKSKELIIFLPLFLIYLGTIFLKSNPEIYSGWITYYAADLLCLPIVLQLSLWGVRIFKSDAELQLTKSQIWVAFIYVSIVFEGVLPFYKDKYTADPIDVVMYLLGTLIYLKLLHKKAS